MQVKKVFSVDTIKINQKAAYVKPKYKTYRELLDLDRPKKIIQHQSDDENDDFLQKLMKKEKKKQQEQKEKEKEKKQSAKSKQLSQAQQSQPSNNQPTVHLQIQKKKASKENSRLPSARSKQNDQNDSVEYLEKKIETQEMGSNINSSKKKNTTQNEQLQLSEIRQSSSNYNKKQPIKVSIRKRNSSQDNLRKNHKLHSDNKKDSKANTEEQIVDNFIKLSQTEANKIIKHNFIASHKLRKADGLKELQRNTHQERQMIKNADNLIQTKLNPQKKLIQHTINPQKYIKQNQISYSQRAKDYLLKSASSPPVQMILMSKSLRNLNQSKYKTAMIARKSLFKSSYQEELFIKSLKRQ